jgi:uncharacterized protein (TIGR03086 family)
MEPLEALARADAEFDRRLRAITPDDLDRATPCDGWTVRDLVNHVVIGNRMSVVLLEGGSREDGIALFATDALGDDYLLAYEDTVADARAEFAAPGALDLTVHHAIGDIPATQFLEFRIADLTLHTWDLARAVGADEQLDPELCEHVLESLLPMKPFIGTFGVFGQGPSGDVGDDAPAQLRVLDLTGRRP